MRLKECNEQGPTNGYFTDYDKYKPLKITLYDNLKPVSNERIPSQTQ